MYAAGSLRQHARHLRHPALGDVTLGPASSPAGAVRRRAVFGLFDADGWSWAGIKATFWFLVFVFLLAYVPNLAYYFTVSDTVKVGYSVLSPINWCPATNESLPCPAPAGAVVPWQPSPIELKLPAALSGAWSPSRVSTSISSAAPPPPVRPRTSRRPRSVRTATSCRGPPVRRCPSRGRRGGRVHDRCAVHHRRPGCRREADRHRVHGHRRGRRGERLGPGRRHEQHPGPDAADAPQRRIGGATSGGLYLFGGTTADGLSATSYVAAQDGRADRVAAARALPLPEARADATAIALGNTMYVFGGTGLAGPTTTIYRLNVNRPPACPPRPKRARPSAGRAPRRHSSCPARVRVP